MPRYLLTWITEFVTCATVAESNSDMELFTSPWQRVQPAVGKWLHMFTFSLNRGWALGLQMRNANKQTYTKYKRAASDNILTTIKLGKNCFLWKEVCTCSGHPDEKPPWWDLPNERPTWWETTLVKAPWWETTLMKDHPDERPPWWETTLVKNHPDKRPPWSETILVKDHPEERTP